MENKDKKIYNFTVQEISVKSYGKTNSMMNDFSDLHSSVSINI